MSDYAILVDGEVVPVDDIRAWSAWFNTLGNRVVGNDTIGNARVSTVFLGINHGFGTPQWFETMIFGGEHSEFQWRYETMEQAIEGHKLAVSLVRGDALEGGEDAPEERS